MDDDLLADHLQELYGAAREDFIEERDRRVRQLRDDGHREESQALGKARKPTVPAWAVDQLARRERDRIDELLAAGQDLRDAQRRASSGRGADGLRTATRRLRDLVSDLRGTAADVISAAGASPSSHLEDVERTLFTGAVTPAHHEALRRGTLDRPLEGAGFGGVEGLLVAPPVEDDDTGASGDDEGRQREEERRREEERQRKAARRRLERQRRDLQRSLADQEGRAERARDKAEQLRARAEAAEAAQAEEEAERERIAAELATVEEELASLGS